MPKYQCPECEKVLKREIPVEAGKKIRCPKCEFVFKAKPMPEEDEEPKKKKVKPAPAKKPTDDDEEEGGTYGVMKDEDDEDEDEKDPKKKKKKKGVEYGSLRDKFAKSKRGPAMAKTIKPSNLVLMQGFLDGLFGIGMLIFGLWPFIFSQDTPRGGDAREKILIMFLGVLIFTIGALACYGASKLQSLESYNWAFAGCVLAIISVVPTGAIGGALGIKILKEQDVIDGFEETLTSREY